MWHLRLEAVLLAQHGLRVIGWCLAVPGRKSCRCRCQPTQGQSPAGVSDSSSCMTGLCSQLLHDCAQYTHCSL